MKKSIYTYLSIALASMLTLFSGCEWLDCPDDCVADEENRKVLLLYSAGYNSLRSYLLDDIKELKEGWLPGKGCDDDILLVYTHSTKANGIYGVPTNPYLIRLYKGKDGEAVSDTLETYDEGTISSSAAQLNNVLTYVKNTFPSGSYGMIFSSHATGYLPAGFYSKPDGYVYQPRATSRSASGKGFGVPTPVPYVDPGFDPSLPMVKSVGQDQRSENGEKVSYEMEIADFAEAIPMKLDYLLFDACLMGGVEVAYELRGKCGKLGFSQAEVLAEGLDYRTLTSHLLQPEVPDPKGVCEDYFIQYDAETGIYRSATISLIDCDMLDGLAGVCRDFFTTHRQELATINHKNVQRYYRDNRHWFYDLESILTEAGATEEELRDLHDALNRCVLYKGYTPEFMFEFEISTFSGFSMYLPCHGNTELDKFYRTLKWNEASGLVE